MAVSNEYLAYVIDQLGGRGYSSRRMFGGVGLYSGELFFALIADDTLYFKVDDSNREDFVARGCEAFRPFPDDPGTVSMNYFSVPEDVLEDPEELARWRVKACAVAAAAAAAKTLRTSGARGKTPQAKKAKRSPKRSRRAR